MTLPVTIPNQFANATSSIPLSQLDSNFNTLANTINEINAGTQQLSNANVATLIVTGNATIGDASSDTVTLNSTLTANTAVIFTAGTSAAPSITTTGDTNTGIFFPAADTIAFTEGGAEAMRIDSSGRMGIGTTSPSSKLVITDTLPYLTINGTTAAGNRGIAFQWNGTTFGSLNQNADTGETSLSSGDAGSGFYLTFKTSNTERARITSGGYFKASNSGSYADATGNFHEIRQTANETSAQIRATSASYTANVLVVEADRNTTNNTYYAIGFFHGGAGAFKFRVADSGNVTNTNGSYGTISDFKLKQDIVDAGNQWDDIKNLRFRKYRLKSDVEANPDAKPMLGLVAQEAELVSPGLIEEHKDTTQETRTREISAVLDEDGNEIEPARTEEYTETVDLGTTTKSIKTSILYMKAVKALQEAMERIETLEAKVSALEAK